MSRFRPSKGPVLAGLALCLVLAAAICYYHAQQPLSPAAGPAAIPASTDNWGLSFPQEGQTPVGNASPEELAKYNARFLGDTSQKVIYLTFDCGYENGYTDAILVALHKAAGARCFCRASRKAAV